jgi:beta-phosphoglucomutase-like phosphatase (HAD superfamily)
VGAVRAFIFDLDGTLADTEGLKALTYKRIVESLTGDAGTGPKVLTLYPTLVGGTDEQMVRALVDQFGLAEPLKPFMAKYSVDQPWMALHLLRFEIYRSTTATPSQLRERAYEGTLQLARDQAAAGRTVAVATSSPTDEAKRVVGALGLGGIVREIVGLDQVRNHKPDPEIYLLTAKRIGVKPSEAVAVEDSPTGIRAALAAGMSCVAIANEFTEETLRRQPFLDQQWVVYDRSRLREVVERRIATLSGDHA